ncbi:MAG: TasA family protein [Dehalococcoidia bacterium]|nr:TasA family protein [Dehalococcoidia bacterium]
MKRIIALSAALLLVIATLSVGTYAYFSDTETTSGQVITAGTFDLKIDNADAPVNILTGISDVMPGGTNSADVDYATLKFLGNGSTNVLYITLTDWIANENDPDTDPEGDDPDDTANGDLDNLLYVAFLIDLDNNGIDTGDKYLKTDNTIGTVGEGESWADIDALASAFEAMEDDAYPSITTNLSNDGTVQFYFYYNFPNNNAADNEAQGDSVQMDFQFELRQS